MEEKFFILSVLSALFCFFCALACFYLSDRAVVLKSKRVGFLICGIVLLVPMFSVFRDDNVYLLVARSIIFLFFGFAIISDAIICRIAVRWTMAVEFFLGLMVLISGMEIVIKFAILKFAS